MSAEEVIALEPAVSLAPCYAVLRRVASQFARENKATFEFHHFLVVMRFQTLVATVAVDCLDDAGGEPGRVRTRFYTKLVVDISRSDAKAVAFSEVDIDKSWEHMELVLHRTPAWSEPNVFELILGQAFHEVVRISKADADYKEADAKRKAEEDRETDRPMMVRLHEN